MRLWPQNLIDRRVEKAVAAERERAEAKLSDALADAKSTADESLAIARQEAKAEAEREIIQRAMGQLASQAPTGTMLAPPSPRPSFYAFDTPQIYAQRTTSRQKPKTRIDLEALRRLASTYDVARACIEHLKSEVAAVPISFVPVDPEDKSPGTQRDIERMTAWFSSRQGGLGGVGRRRRHFENQILEDALVIGAYAVAVDATLGGTPYEAHAIDAMTIRPKVDAYGWQHPQDAFEQQVMGVTVRASISMDELIYDGIHSQSYTPYFCSPLEWLFGVMVSALKADEWNRTWLTDGNVPDMLIAAPETWTPGQIMEYAPYIDAMLSGNGERHKAKLVPGGMKNVVQQTRKDADFQEFELWLMRRTCSIFGVQPASIGFAGEQYKVSQEGSMTHTTQFGAGRLLEMRKDLYDELLERHGVFNVQCINVTEGEESPSERTARLAQSDWLTINEKRAEEGREPLPGGDELAALQQDDSDADPNKSAKEKQRGDIERWERKAISRLKERGSAQCAFNSIFIPPGASQMLSMNLGGCKSIDDVRNLFRSVAQTLGHQQ